MLVLGVTVAAVSVPYVRQSPGPTVDVLGTRKGEPVVEVDGERTFPTDGSLRLTTVLVTQPQRAFNVLGALGGWLDQDTAVLPYEALYPADTTAEDEQAESAAQMVSSQDTAVAAALTKIGYDLPTYAEVTGVTPDSPSEGELEPRDRIVSLEGRRVTRVQQVFDAVGRAEPGDTLTGEVRRAGRTRSFEVTTKAAADDPDRAMLGILVGTGYVFPFDVSIGISDSIGGPERRPDLLPRRLRHPDRGLADRGTRRRRHRHHRRRRVGRPHRRDPAEDLRCRGDRRRRLPRAAGQLRRGAGDRPDDRDIRLVRAETMSSAVEALEDYRDDPDAELPRCTA